MLKLEEIKKNAAISGIELGQVVRVVTTEPVGDNALTIYYKTPDGKLHERMLFRTDEAKLSLAEAGRPWAFDAPGEEFKLAAEAYRINLAHLFDPMMAVHTSNVEPLPHQITAVYESMLPRQPLRYVLADDPGAGKTIMAGLLIFTTRTCLEEKKPPSTCCWILLLSAEPLTTRCTASTSPSFTCTPASSPSCWK